MAIGVVSSGERVAINVAHMDTSITVSGDNTFLAVWWTFHRDNTLTSIDYNGTNLTQGGLLDRVGNLYGYHYYIYNPDAGTHDLSTVHNSTGNDRQSVIWTLLSGVRPNSHTIYTSTWAYIASWTDSETPVSNGIYLGLGGNGKNQATDPTIDDGVELQKYNTTWSTVEHKGGACYEYGDGTSKTLGMSFGTGNYSGGYGTYLLEPITGAFKGFMMGRNF